MAFVESLEIDASLFRKKNQIILHVHSTHSRWSLKANGANGHSHPAAVAVKRCLPCVSGVTWSWMGKGLMLR